MTVDRDTVSSFIKEDSASAEILKEMAAEAKNEDLAVSMQYTTVLTNYYIRLISRLEGYYYDFWCLFPPDVADRCVTKLLDHFII